MSSAIIFYKNSRLKKVMSSYKRFDNECSQFLLYCAFELLQNPKMKFIFGEEWATHVFRKWINNPSSLGFIFRLAIFIQSPYLIPHEFFGLIACTALQTTTVHAVMLLTFFILRKF